jgi:hypothetical protein
MEAGAPPLSSTPTAMIFSVGCQAISLPLQRRSNFATHSPVLLSHCKKVRKKGDEKQNIKRLAYHYYRGRVCLMLTVFAVV